MAQTDVQSSVPIVWKFGSLLDELEVNVYQLAKLTKGKVSRNALYALKNQKPSSINFDTLEAIIPALETLSGKRVTLNDVMEYER